MKNIKNPSSDLFSIKTYKAIIQNALDNDSFFKKIGIEYQAYDKKILDSLLNVNEGLNPHLCWRNLTPQEAIKTGNQSAF